jgi:hypothetical protein
MGAEMTEWDWLALFLLLWFAGTVFVIALYAIREELRR